MQVPSAELSELTRADASRSADGGHALLADDVRGRYADRLTTVLGQLHVVVAHPVHLPSFSPQDARHCRAENSPVVFGHSAGLRWCSHQRRRCTPPDLLLLNVRGLEQLVQSSRLAQGEELDTT